MKTSKQKYKVKRTIKNIFPLFITLCDRFRTGSSRFRSRSARFWGRSA